MRHQLRFLAGPAATVVISIATLLFLQNTYGLPGILRLSYTAARLVETGTLGQDVAVSGIRWLGGWLIGATLGLLAGLITGRMRLAETLFESFLTMMRAIPFIALVPLSLRFFGIGETGKLFVVSWAVFFICWVATHQAAISISTVAEWRAKSLRLSLLERLQTTILPALEQPVFIALRTSLLIGLIVVAVAELAGAYDRSSRLFFSEGLGYRMFRALDQSRDDVLLVSILTFALLGILGEHAFSLIWKAVRRLRRHVIIRQARSQFAAAQIVPVTVEKQRLEREPSALSVNGLSVAYGDLEVLKDIHFQVDKGKVLAVVGRSGTGKSTLLKALACFDDPRMTIRGKVTLNGRAASSEDFGLVLQDAPIFEHMTVWQNVIVGHPNRKNLSPADLSDVVSTLRQFEIDDLVDRMASELSGGQRQRVAFATAYISRPHVLLCDEPNSALDAVTRRSIQSFFVSELKARGDTSTVWVTHDIEEALIVADKVAVISDGKIDLIEFEKPDESKIKNWVTSQNFSSAKEYIISILESN